MKNLHNLWIGVILLIHCKLVFGFIHFFQPRNIRGIISVPVDETMKIVDSPNRLNGISLWAHNSNEEVSTEDDDYFNADDDELAKSMARELFYDLSQDSELLSIDDFIAWDDIQDVLNGGIIRRDTLEIIFETSGVTTNVLTFEQFTEVVGKLYKSILYV